MTSRYVFEQAREGVIRMREIEDRLVIMHERIGVQGRALEASFSQGLDPMRKVDELLDWEAEEYEVVMGACGEAIEDANLLLAGLKALGYDEPELTLRLVYICAMPVERVAATLGKTSEVVEMVCSTTFGWIDSTGMARVKEAGRAQAQ